MAIIWVNIWNIQKGNKAKELINRCFNIGSFIVTIQDVNMNPSVPQYKNCYGVMQPSPAESKVTSASNVIDSTKWSIIAIMLGTVKVTVRLIL